MQVQELGHGVIAFVRPQEGANAGLIRTAEGVIVVDTTSSARDMQVLLDAVGVSSAEVCLVINTHLHGDHTWGNQLFDCPILAHRLCREGMAANLEGPWKMENILASIAERERAEPQWAAAEMRQTVQGLRIVLPGETFEQRRDLSIGGVPLQVIHMGGHTRGSSVVWLPEAGVLMSGDLLFVGRYPFLGDADIPALITALGRLLEFEAQAIVPGHGPLCDGAAVEAMRSYLQETWSRTVDHLAAGHTADEAAADAGYPRYAEEGAGRYHTTNIRLMYAQLAGGESCPL